MIIIIYFNDALSTYLLTIVSSLEIFFLLKQNSIFMITWLNNIYLCKTHHFIILINGYIVVGNRFMRQKSWCYTNFADVNLCHMTVCLADFLTTCIMS